MMMHKNKIKTNKSKKGNFSGPLHLSRLENISFDPVPVNDSFPNEQLAAIKVTSQESPWYADYANFIVSKYLPPTFTAQQRRKLFYDLRSYFWDDPHLYKGVDGIMRRCVPEYEQQGILRNVMVVLMEDIMLEIGLHKKFYNQVFIGLSFLKMQESLFYLVMNTKELVIFLDAMKCL
jgi:hypothetical protein